MGYVTESWGDRHLARMRGLDQRIREKQEAFAPAFEELFRMAQNYEMENEMNRIFYDLVDVQGSESRGSYTACRVCGAVVTVTDHEKHDEWHASLKPSSRPSRDEVVEARMSPESVFSEGTGVAVLCPHCGSMNCTFRNEFVKARPRQATLPFRCTKCENKFNVVFEGTERWTGMVTESVS